MDRLLDRARREGEFDNLEGQGKLIEELANSYNPDWWAKSYLKREGVDVLPPELELRRKASEALGKIAEIPSEAKLRETFERLNEEIGKHNRTVTSGPASGLVPFDLERILSLWKAKRSER